MAAADSFSLLPDDLLVRVIFFLPARDAARTSVLSRRWRSLWLSTDALNLDSSSYGSSRPNQYSRSLEPYQLKKRLLSDAGAALSAAGRCPVTKLSLFVNGQNERYCRDVMSDSTSAFGYYGTRRDPYDLLVELLAVAELRRIEELRLDFYTEKGENWMLYLYNLDAAVLPSNTLRVLDLACSWIKLPQGDGGATFLLPRLSMLRLRGCYSPMKDLEDFIRAAPCLDSLHIQCHNFNSYRDTSCDRLTLHCPTVTTLTLASLKLEPNESIEVDAPCLHTFKYEGGFVDFSIKPPAATELARVELAFITTSPPRCGPFYLPEKPWFSPFWRFIYKFRHAKILKLKVPNIEGIAVHKDVQHEHLVMLPGLQRLELEGHCSDDPGRRGDAAVAVANLLQCCPVMNSLQIRIIKPNNGFRDISGSRVSVLPDFRASLNLFEGRRYPKQITAITDDAPNNASSQVADLPGLSGCDFDCLRNHLKNVKLEFELKDLNTFEVCLARFFGENVSVLEILQIDDGKRKFLSHISWMVDRWRADALDRPRLQMETDSADAKIGSQVAGQRPAAMVPSSQIILSPPKQRDRISNLPDGVLGHVLSFLPTPEAGRAALLCRRWRYIFGHMHTISYEEQEGERSTDWDTFYHVAKERKSCSGKLLDAINVALLCRRRCAGRTDHVPLRSFRVAFDNIVPGWDARHVDQWLTYVLQHAGREARDLQLDLRFLLGPICAHDNPRFNNYGWSGPRGHRSAMADKNSFQTDSDSDEDHDMGSYRLPGRLFSCAALKTLCLGHCQLKLPSEVNLPCLETLGLTGILTDSGRSVQRLVQSCPCLQDLTLEAVRHLRTLSVLHRRLRRFALRCCHNAKSVHIDASELVSLEYHGAVPAESLLTLHGSLPQKYSCTVDICTQVTKNVAEYAAFRKFLGSFSGTQRLHLHHGRLHRRCLSSGGLPLFPCMTRLVLQGRVESLGFVGVLRHILEHTPNLEVLTLYMAEQTEQQQHQASASGDGWRGRENAAAVVSFAKPCLRLRVKEINMVHYEGNETQRTLARLVFGNAMVLERLCVVFKKERFAVQAGLKKEIEALARASSERIFM